ncbi:MAG: hypothetical protein JW725_02330 [Candidatus Babeliaceae bacterium]|nr:hypothetical protein [Candidatus Babeliaceae bacterium]
MASEHDHCECCGHHSNSLYQELICHVPYAAFSLAVGFIILSLINFWASLSLAAPRSLHTSYLVLFHSFHYLHVMIAVTGSVITFFRFSNRLIVGVLVSIISPTFFCVLSDIMLPTLAGNLLGVPMKMHVCFFTPHDTLNVISFMLVGFLCGLAILAHGTWLRPIAITSHFLHVLAGACASMFYMVANGLYEWFRVMGPMLFFLFLAVLLPCTMSDLVVPIFCARFNRKKDRT